MYKELKQASSWFNNHKLSLNLSKTKVMFFGTTRTLQGVNDNTFNFESNSIEIVDSYKYLGLMLDCKLSFDKHVNY